MSSLAGARPAGLRQRWTLRWLAAGIAALALLFAALGATLPAKSARASRDNAPATASGALGAPARVAVLALENKSYGQVIGSPDAPYLNQLARRYALATDYYAVAHPSLPNYIALTGGSKFGIDRNCAACHTHATNLVEQLNAKGISWKAYFEDLSSSSAPGRVTHGYNPHYNPFVYYDAVRGRPANRSRIVAFDSLNRDLNGGSPPRFMWIAPGVHHDGHSASLRASDRYVSRLIPRVLRALGPRGVLFVTWDEGARQDHAGINGSRGGGHVALIAAGPGARQGATTAVPANHYALLRTIEVGFGLRPLQQAGAATTPLLSGLLNQTASRPPRAALPSVWRKRVI